MIAKKIINSNLREIANTQKIDTLEVSKPTVTVVRKDGKTIIRMLSPEWKYWIFSFFAGKFISLVK